MSKPEHYLIWSNEHQAWWRAESRGYTTLLQQAGRYSFDEAITICNGANYSWDEDNNPLELPVSEKIALELRNRMEH